MERDTGVISELSRVDAVQELGDLFELFEDEDVLDMFSMAEPPDAAVAGHDPGGQHLGIVDQRLEAWFVPFGGIPATGHLGSRSPDS